MIFTSRLLARFAAIGTFFGHCWYLLFRYLLMCFLGSVGFEWCLARLVGLLAGFWHVGGARGLQYLADLLDDGHLAKIGIRSELGLDLVRDFIALLPIHQIRCHCLLSIQNVLRSNERT